MTYQTELPMSSFIAYSVMGRKIEYINEETQKTEYYRETIDELSHKFKVEIVYNNKAQKFVITGTNADEVAQELRVIQKQKISEKMKQDNERHVRMMKQKELEQKLGCNPNDIGNDGFICKGRYDEGTQIKIKEMKQRAKSHVKNNKKQDTKVKKSTKKDVFIDRNNMFSILQIDDDEESDRIQLKLDHETLLKSLRQDIAKLEKQQSVVEGHMTHAEKNKIHLLERFDKGLDNELITSHVDVDIIKYRKELLQLESKINSLYNQVAMPFEEYEMNQTLPPLEMISDEELNEIVNADVDYPPKSKLDEEVTNNKKQRKNKFIDEKTDKYLENTFPTNRNYYEKRQYREKNSNQTKSETWTAKENHKRDNRKHSKSHNPRHHGRSHVHFDAHDMDDELANATRIPTDKIKDKLDKLITVADIDQSEFPPLVSEN